MNSSDVQATVLTNGWICNELVGWLLTNGAAVRLIEQKPRERAKMQAMQTFLESGREWWLLLNHYASPQFVLAEVPDDKAVLAAQMYRQNGSVPDPLSGSVLKQDGDCYQTDFIPTGCLWLRRDAVESIRNSRPFEYRHSSDGELTGSGDRTLSDALMAASFDLWIWKRRCLLRQEVWI